MSKVTTIKGLWFLPTNVERKVSGILTYTIDSGVELEIDEPFDEEEHPFQFDLGKADIILGTSRNEEPITLYSCFRQNSKWGISYCATWYANEAYIGCHAQTPSELTFSRIRLEISPLFMWLNSSGIKAKNLTTPDLGVTFEYTKPGSISFPIDEKATGELGFSVSHSFPSSYSETINLNHSAGLEIETIDNILLSNTELWAYGRRFLNWLTVVTGYTCEVERVSFYHNDIIKQELADGTKIYQEIVRYRKRNAVRKKPERPDQFFFDLPKIKKFMPQVLTEWFSLYSSIEVVLQILAENMGRNTPFSEFHFKDIIQALEAFHRKLIRNSRLPKADYKAYKRRIIEQIADEVDRTYIDELLKYANEPRLRERLVELIERYNILALQAIIGNKDDFIKLVIENRNYHTHLDNSGKKSILKPTELYFLSEKALALLFVAVMCEVIPDKDFINQIIGTSNRWSHLMRNDDLA